MNPASSFPSICQWLDGAGVSYRTVHHEPTHTSEESAKARGEEVRVGGKALLVKTGEEFRLFVLSAACKLDSSALKARFGVKKIRFASAQELADLTGLVPGSVPPFGRPILPFELFVDESIVKNDRIAFNAGSLTDSIVMPTEEYLKVALPAIFLFSE
ncbi:MAG TPA: YbaK/EbsC family protein [Phycisphaerae bacterium]|nr:YbaK/EbsC family protein [Phycisphaerae bacterium]